MMLPDNLTIGKAYGPLSAITTRAEADEYFNALVERQMRLDPTLTQEDAVLLERHNIGYWTGYLDRDAAERIMTLFQCEHPVFGKGAEDLQPQDLIDAGMAWVKAGLAAAQKVVEEARSKGYDITTAAATSAIAKHMKGQPGDDEMQEVFERR